MPGLQGVTLAPILGALVAPRRQRPVVRVRPAPWMVATFLARALQGDALCRAVHESSAQLLALLVEDGSDPRCDEAITLAIALRDRAAELPEADRAPVVVALLRDLLDDAPTRTAVDFDRALVAAAHRCGTTPTARHRGLAVEIRAAVVW